MNRCCKGCASYIDHECEIIDTNEGGCPCNDCLIKIMCGDGCDEYYEYYEKMYDGLRENTAYYERHNEKKI